MFHPPGKNLHFLTTCRKSSHLSYFYNGYKNIRSFEKKVALLFSARGGQCLAENVAVAFPDGHKLHSDYGAYDKTNPPAAGMIAATSKSG
jgi:hypothetical protein